MERVGCFKAPIEEPKECEVLINTTQRCNLRCKYCFVDKNYSAFAEKANISVMNSDVKNACLLFLEKYGAGFETLTLHFYGGEPFTEFEAMREITKKMWYAGDRIGTKISFSVTTNGTLIDGQRAAFLDQFGYSVLVSCDGPPKIHDFMRVTKDCAPTFARVCQTIELLKTFENIKLGLSAVIHRFNRLAETYRFLNAFCPDFIKAEYIRLEEGHPFDLRKAEKKIYFQDVEQIADDVASNLLKGRVPVDYRFNARMLQMWRQIERSHFCAAGDGVLGIAANGDIYPCSLLIGIEDCLIGNVFDGINFNQARAFKNWHAASGKESCRRCDIRNFCGGGCAAMWKTAGRGFCEYIRNEVELARRIFDRVAAVSPESLALLVSRDFYGQLKAMMGTVDRGLDEQTL